MEEFSEKSAVSRKSKYFTDIESCYSLRNTPARFKSTKKSKHVSNFVQCTNHGSPISSNLPIAQVIESPEPLCPLRNRISAIQNSEGKKEPLENGNNAEEEVKEDIHDLESPKIVSATLLEFRKVHGQLLMSKTVSKPMTTAYTMLRRNINLECSHKRMGTIPGIEIGDVFKSRAEMALIGLHPNINKNVTRIVSGERRIAVSLLYSFLGPFSNIVRMSTDVLVWSRDGYINNDPKIELGHLALANSIDVRNSIRVVLGFRKGFTWFYVYAGLYLVEKYWMKRGNNKYFQLRRLTEQAGLDLELVTKAMISDAGRKFISEDKHESHGNFRVNCSGKRKREEKEEEGEFCVKVNEHAENRKRIKQLIYEFLSTFEKLSENKKVRKEKMERSGYLRFDFDAYDTMKSKHKYLRNVDQCLGCISGVDVGDVFHFRVQLQMLGLHCSTKLDIDYLTKDGILLATSIASAHFEDFDSDAFKTDTLVFAGYGRKKADQKMVFGNLALKNNINAKVPIRIFRGLKRKGGGVSYIYYGLYMVEKFWKKKNTNGHSVFMFRSNRLLDQPKVNFEANGTLRWLKRTNPVYSDDISRGMEKIPIRVVNTVDKEKLPYFNYTTEVIHTSKFNPVPSRGCGCIDGCKDSDSCACAVRNGGELPFNSEGLIVKAKPLIYECGPSCKCPPSCWNKVGQNGIKFPFEVFKTKKMGWGVRSPVFIPMGSFICEFTGELLEDEEAQKRSNDDYIFAIGNNYYDESLWEGFPSVPSLQNSDPSDNSECDGGFSIDALKIGNFGRLINHKCTPNLYAQNVLYDHDDKRMPHIVFFACEDIPARQELSYHYNYTIDGVHDANGTVRKKNCYCGSYDCTGRLY